MITVETAHQHLAKGFPAGMRFHSAPVVQLADASPCTWGTSPEPTAPALYVFADRPDPASPDSRARQLCDFLASDKSPITWFTPVGAEPDSVIDVRAVSSRRGSRPGGQFVASSPAAPEGQVRPDRL